MSASAPVSTLTSDQLLRLSAFNRSVADQLDDAFVLSTTVASAADFVIDSGMLTTNTPEQNRAAMQTAIATATNFGGCRIRVRAKTGVSETIYQVGRSGGSAWSLLVQNANNITIEADRGVWLQHPVGMPNASVAILRIDTCNRIVLKNIGIDGNWGNSVNGVDDNTGINHATQTDPKNYGLDIRFSDNVSIVDVDIRQTYGDGIHLAGGTNVNVVRTTIDMTGRNGFTFAGRSNGTTIRDCSFTNCFAGTIDTEPVNSTDGVNNVLIDRTRIGRWWSDAVIRLPLSIVGSDNAAHDSSAARGYRVTNCLIEGPVLVSNAYDCVIQKCRIICDYATNSASPIYIDHVSEDITVRDCYIYDRGGSPGDTHLGAVAVRHYITLFRPTRVRLQNLTVCAKNGRNGIAIDGAGGVRSYNGTATGVTATTITDAAAVGWTTNQFSGSLVVMGGVTGVINSNTTTVLTIFGWFNTPAGGSVQSTPAAGAYKIIGRRCGVEVDNCTVDCTDDGHGNGGVGLYLDAGDITAVPGNSQIKIRKLTVLNATTDAVQVQSRNAANPFRLLVLDGIHAMDDQPTPTCTTAVRFQGTANFTKLLVRDVNVDGVANTFAGTGTASPNVTKWLIKDGLRQEWEGFGAPTFSAAVGTRYWRLDPTNANTTLYINNDGATSWTAK